MAEDKKLPPMPDLHIGQDKDGTYWAEWHTYHGVGDSMTAALEDLTKQIREKREDESNV